MSGIKRTTTILAIIENDDNSGTRELNNQDGKKNEEEIARYVPSSEEKGGQNLESRTLSLSLASILSPVT